MTSIVTLGLGLVEGATLINAEGLENSKINYTKTEIESKLNSANSEIRSLQEDMYSAQKQLEELEQFINSVRKEIEDKNQNMIETKQKIETFQKEISNLTERMESRSEILKERVSSYQESGVIRYVDVLIGSKSFTNFIERAEAVAIIIGADRDIFREQQKDKELLEKAEDEMKSELLSIEMLLTDLKEKEKELTVKQQEQTKSIVELQAKEEYIQSEIFTLEKMKKQLLIIKENNQQTTTSTVEISHASGASEFIWPTIGGTITSYQGMRWGSFHKGIDIARPSDYSILAARGGTVSYAGWINGYGNTIKIIHNNGFTTQYAHLASIGVQVGQNVPQGSTIGVMGTTGRSTGIHLDFEVYQNGKLLNPIDVLPS